MHYYYYSIHILYIVKPIHKFGCRRRLDHQGPKAMVDPLPAPDDGYNINNNNSSNNDNNDDNNNANNDDITDSANGNNDISAGGVKTWLE